MVRHLRGDGLEKAARESLIPLLVIQHAVELDHCGSLLLTAPGISPPMEIKILELKVVNKSSECSHVSST
jgi:hypothetical protein